MHVVTHLKDHVGGALSCAPAAAAARAAGGRAFVIARIGTRQRECPNQAAKGQRGREGPVAADEAITTGKGEDR
jgi:hypothetical protein